MVQFICVIRYRKQQSSGGQWRDKNSNWLLISYLTSQGFALAVLGASVGLLKHRVNDEPNPKKFRATYVCV
jgi:hypothetical protein